MICLGDGLLSLSDSELELDIRSECVLKCSSSSKHSRLRQTDTMSSERANRVCELRVSEEQSVIRHRKQSFLVKQRTSSDKQSMTIIEAVLEYISVISELFYRACREKSSEFAMNCHKATSSHIHREGFAGQMSLPESDMIVEK